MRHAIHAALARPAAHPGRCATGVSGCRIHMPVGTPAELVGSTPAASCSGDSPPMPSAPPIRLRAAGRRRFWGVSLSALIVMAAVSTGRLRRFERFALALVFFSLLLVRYFLRFTRS